MFNALWQLLRRLLGRDQEPPCHPEPKENLPEPQDHGPNQATRPEDKPDTGWVDKLNRPPAGGDWLRERLRSLPDEENVCKPDGPKHRHRL